jgi:F0F1-type ATP synthase assembly protein I
MRPDPDNRYRYMRLVGSVGTIPLMLGVGPLLGYFAGRWLDRKFGIAPWLEIVLLGLGFAAVVRYIVRLLKQVQKDIDRM